MGGGVVSSAFSVIKRLFYLRICGIFGGGWRGDWQRRAEG